MTDQTHDEIRLGRVMRFLKEYWFLLVAVIGLATTGATAWVTTKAQAAEALKIAESNASTLLTQPWVQSLKNMIAEKADKVLTDAEIDRIWAQIRENADNAEEMADVVRALELSDQQVKSKIELEVEKLKAEIQRQSAAQNTVLQEILREVRTGD